jgi:hypothetical protein
MTRPASGGGSAAWKTSLRSDAAALRMILLIDHSFITAFDAIDLVFKGEE